MIIKSYEISKINLKNNPYILFYGKNEGLKKESIITLLKDKKNSQIYEEKEILENSKIFLENLFSKSLFETEKIIIIKRATEKILTILSEIIDKNLKDIILIINADSLEKKSKLRSFFEKSKNSLCIAFYPDNEQTLYKLCYNILKEKKISISPANINLIISRCNGDRENLLNELKKIEYFTKNGKKATTEIITKLTNLAENHGITELVDSCLAKNNKKIINILNENNFTNEDCILITRTFLNKSKKILKLSNEYENNKNIDLTISTAQPPIFWKDKEITKQQVYKWTPKNIKNLIYKLNELELIMKKNLNNSINLITDFILDQSSSKN